MSFEWPAALLGLAALPLLLGAYMVMQRRRKRFAVRFTNLDLLADVVKESPRWRRHIPPLLALLALAALIVALARPQTTIQVPKEQATVMLTTDVSGSMQATDVEPDRITAARDAAKSFSEKLPEKFRLGLVSFNQQSQLLVPPTTDRALIESALSGLTARGGTAMGDALDSSLASLRTLARQQSAKERRQDRKRRTAVVVLLSDGKNTGGAIDPIQAAETAKKLRIPIHTVALGTDEGTVSVTDESGFPQSVPVPPDRDTLRQVAKTTGGRYFDAPDAGKLSSIYEQLGSRIGYDKETREITYAFTGAGLGLMLLGSAFSLLWFGRLP